MSIFNPLVENFPDSEFEQVLDPPQDVVAVADLTGLSYFDLADLVELDDRRRLGVGTPQMCGSGTRSRSRWAWPTRWSAAPRCSPPPPRATLATIGGPSNWASNELDKCVGPGHLRSPQ